MKQVIQIYIWFLFKYKSSANKYPHFWLQNGTLGVYGFEHVVTRVNQSPPWRFRFYTSILIVSPLIVRYIFDFGLQLCFLVQTPHIFEYCIRSTTLGLVFAY
jgi:formate/nitrite transporter FocA (FNT family)